MFKLGSKQRKGADMARIPMIGLCRFSYPSTSGYQTSFKTAEEQTAFLYGEARMAVRFSLFETITLPSLRAQTDRNFRFVVVIGTDMPGPWRARLETAVETLPGAEVVALEPRQPWSIFSDTLRARAPQQDGPVLQFRLDDDDGLAVDYVARLRGLDWLPRLRREGRGPVAVNFTQGLDLGFDGERFLGVAETQAPVGSYGQALLTRQTSKRSIMGFQHHKIWGEVPHVALPGGPMFLRTRHPGQDTPRGRGAQPEAMPRAEAEPLLRERFGLSLNALEAIRWAP